MVTDGGGWTLVWSNLKGGGGKPATQLSWLAAINTLPRFQGEPSADLESFQVYMGLSFWPWLSPNGQLRYDWSPEYGVAVAQSATMSYALNKAQNWSLITTGLVQTKGSVMPGIWTEGHPSSGTIQLNFSTYDSDHDTSGINCSDTFNSPWWYTACWSGSLNGGGELSAGGFASAAFWTGAANSPGIGATGQGYGNGWMFVR